MARSYDALGLEETETCTILIQNDYNSPALEKGEALGVLFLDKSID